MSIINARPHECRRHIFTAADINQTKAAKFIGVSVTTLSEMESGARPILVDRLMLLAKLYRVQPVDILGDTRPGKRAAS